MYSKEYATFDIALRCIAASIFFRFPLDWYLSWLLTRIQFIHDVDLVEICVKSSLVGTLIARFRSQYVLFWSWLHCVWFFLVSVWCLHFPAESVIIPISILMTAILLRVDEPTAFVLIVCVYNLVISVDYWISYFWLKVIHGEASHFAFDQPAPFLFLLLKSSPLLKLFELILEVG